MFAATAFLCLILHLVKWGVLSTTGWWRRGMAQLLLVTGKGNAVSEIYMINKFVFVTDESAKLFANVGNNRE